MIKYSEINDGMYFLNSALNFMVNINLLYNLCSWWIVK